MFQQRYRMILGSVVNFVAVIKTCHERPPVLMVAELLVKQYKTTLQPVIYDNPLVLVFPVLNYRYSKTCHLRSLVWTARCLVRPLQQVKLLCNSIDLMFILPLFYKTTCLLRSIFVENFSGHSKQVLL